MGAQLTTNEVAEWTGANGTTYQTPVRAEPDGSEIKIMPDGPKLQWVDPPGWYESDDPEITWEIWDPPVDGYNGVAATGGSIIKVKFV